MVWVLVTVTLLEQLTLVFLKFKGQSYLAKHSHMVLCFLLLLSEEGMSKCILMFLLNMPNNGIHHVHENVCMIFNSGYLRKD